MTFKSAADHAVSTNDIYTKNQRFLRKKCRVCGYTVDAALLGSRNKYKFTNTKGESIDHLWFYPDFCAVHLSE